MDRSLKTKASLVRHRNVLSRAERIKVLNDEERWRSDASVFGLPKVAHRKVAVGGKVKEKKPKEGEAALGAAGTAAPAAAAAAPDAGAKPAAKSGAKSATKPGAK